MSELWIRYPFQCEWRYTSTRFNNLNTFYSEIEATDRKSAVVDHSEKVNTTSILRLVASPQTSKRLLIALTHSGVTPTLIVIVPSIDI